ncbi:RNA polymerase sigma factor RpoS [Ignatzschineria ureiclastica]|uniref:RNA polymerase sigma factor RpoS n=1 Tax=Ignatzschineria ureiclastica TaxID=472582 RepID=A0A2U2AGJ2_9GAMM|nr:sigma-70 family RNA polymerase sigma factor [Ignatzschineria ureiclastica]PWD81778.1 RNA polymerase sigma factor RpoS [Ignatzschineria ureiclastica]GGZ90472.1 RNA polymerase sigma factor RpoS [Ignatzschineria ureiclastica]
MNRKQSLKLKNVQIMQYEISEKLNTLSIKGDLTEKQQALSIEREATLNFWHNESAISKVLEYSRSAESNELEDILKNRDNKYEEYENDLYLYFSEVGHYRLLSATEEKLLGKAVQEGNQDAFKQIVLGNLRLVIMIAQRYEDRGLDKADLISEGNLGLMHATRKFNPEKGCRFSTYAVWWIRHYIEKAIMNQGRTVRLPIHINKALKKLMSELQQLSQVLQRRPTVKELSEVTGQSLYEIMELLAYQKASLSFDHTEIPAITMSSPNMLQNKQNRIVDFFVENEAFNLLEHILFELEPKEREVIECRFGMNGRSAKTLDKTGKVLGLTRDQVRYLQTKTLEKIRLMLEEHNVSLNDVLA